MTQPNPYFSNQPNSARITAGMGMGNIPLFDNSFGQPNEEQVDEAMDLQGVDLAAFATQLQMQFKRAEAERQPLVDDADKDERLYNQHAYTAQEVPFEGAKSVTVPAARSRVDKASSEIGSSFDQDGAPVYAATPLTDSMATLAPHVEAFVHQNLSLANAPQKYRIGVHRAFKTGTSFIVSEIISRPVQGMNPSGLMAEGESQTYENALVIRSVKQQDMYILPSGISDMKDAGFVGERFQMTRWMFNDSIAGKFYREPQNLEGVPTVMPNGYYNTNHGQAEEFNRLGITNQSGHSDTDPAGVVDLVRAWVFFQAPSRVANGDRKSRLYYVVFSPRMPGVILRLKENPYTLLDRAPYVPVPAGMGDGTIWGESWMKLLRPLQNLLDTLHMLHIESQKRAYSKFYLIKEDSMIANELKKRARKNAANLSEDAAMNPSSGISRIMPDEWFETGDPTGDVKDFGFTDMNPAFNYDESRIINYMNGATIDDLPTAGAVRTAWELRSAATQTAAKLKSYLKTISTLAMKPHIEIVKAQLWEYMMPASQISDYVRFLQYGDVSIPITMTDFFSGISLDPAGTTTSADKTVAVQTTASLMSEIVPILMNVPGIVQDVPGAIREFVKARVTALGYEKFDTVFGLTPPSEGDQMKAAMYLQLVKSLSTNQGMGAQNVLGGDGGMMPQQNMGLGQGGAQGDSQGGSATGITPQIQQAMGGPQGANAQ